MGSKLKQGTRFGQFVCSLGDDALVVTRCEASESMSSLFEFRLDLLSEDDNIDFDALLGTNCCLTLGSNHSGVKRHFNGVLVEGRWAGKTNALTSYSVVLRPWLWLLSRRTDCKIFNEKTVVDIIEEVLGNAPFAKFENRLSASYQPIEYCVQYRESDFAFVSRLMEEYGIYYFFDHQDSGHTLVLCDSASSLNTLRKSVP